MRLLWWAVVAAGVVEAARLDEEDSDERLYSASRPSLGSRRLELEGANADGIDGDYYEKSKEIVTSHSLLSNSPSTEALTLGEAVDWDLGEPREDPPMSPVTEAPSLPAEAEESSGEEEDPSAGVGARLGASMSIRMKNSGVSNPTAIDPDLRSPLLTHHWGDIARRSPVVYGREEEFKEWINWRRPEVPAAAKEKEKEKEKEPADIPDCSPGLKLPCRAIAEGEAAAKVGMKAEQDILSWLHPTGANLKRMATPTMDDVDNADCANSAAASAAAAAYRKITACGALDSDSAGAAAAAQIIGCGSVAGIHSRREAEEKQLSDGMSKAKDQQSKSGKGEGEQESRTRIEKVKVDGKPDEGHSAALAAAEASDQEARAHASVRAVLAAASVIETEGEAVRAERARDRQSDEGSVAQLPPFVASSVGHADHGRSQGHSAAATRGGAASEQDVAADAGAHAALQAVLAAGSVKAT